MIYTYCTYITTFLYYTKLPGRDDGTCREIRINSTESVIPYVHIIPSKLCAFLHIGCMELVLLGSRNTTKFTEVVLSPGGSQIELVLLECSYHSSEGVRGYREIFLGRVYQRIQFLFQCFRTIQGSLVKYAGIESKKCTKCKTEVNEWRLVEIKGTGQ